MKTLRVDKRNRILLLVAVIVLMTALACVRTVSAPESADSEDAAAATKDAQVQMTLGALLGSATAESVPSATPTPAPTEEATATEGSVQLTELAAALTDEAATPSTTPTPAFGEGTSTTTPTPVGTSTACYEHRYVYDETFPDGTRVDPGQSFQKTWRLQNVGTCDWKGGDYALTFVSGARMSGSNPLTITYNVPSGGYANFSLNLIAPSTPGTYRGYWILQTSNGDPIGWGPNQDQAFWVDIEVRGSTPTP